MSLFTSYGKDASDKIQASNNEMRGTFAQLIESYKSDNVDNALDYLYHKEMPKGKSETIRTIGGYRLDQKLNGNTIQINIQRNSDTFGEVVVNENVLKKFTTREFKLPDTTFKLKNTRNENISTSKSLVELVSGWFDVNGNDLNKCNNSLYQTIKQFNSSYSSYDYQNMKASQARDFCKDRLSEWETFKQNIFKLNGVYDDNNGNTTKELYEKIKEALKNSCNGERKIYYVETQ